MAGATKRLEKAHGIKVDTVDPFNEPNTSYWGTKLGADGEPTGGRQEGAHIGPELQQKVLAALAPALKKAKVNVGHLGDGRDQPVDLRHELEHLLAGVARTSSTR